MAGVGLTVVTDAGSTRISLVEGQSVREALDVGAVRVRAACGGTGQCGACGIRLLSGDVNPLTPAEMFKLPAEARAQGMRLACQLRPRGDTVIQVDDPAPPSDWRSIPADDLLPPAGALPELSQHVYGLAVDLGTTHIRLALWDRRNGCRIATRRGANPQAIHGADVLNRLAAARGRPERAEELAGLARTAILHGLRDMLARDMGEVKPMLAQIGQVMVVGNTAMLALLTGQGGEALFEPGNWQRTITIEPREAATWRDGWGLANADIVVPPPLAGFVGSDLPADVIATSLMEGPDASLLLDLGTNTEIALWDGRALHVTSVPGGPAFEGGGIRNGMAADAGAIHRVALADGELRCEVIGGGGARGFCGTGLLDGIAALLRSGALKPSGRFAVSPGAEGIRLVADNPRTAVTGQDVDTFQRAKAALAAGIQELFRRAGLEWGDLRRLCVCGAFGRSLDIANAQAVGLLPDIDRTRIELFADAALSGCERALLSRDGRGLFTAICRKAYPVNLSVAASYEDCYIDQLRLRPLREAVAGRSA